MFAKYSLVGGLEHFYFSMKGNFIIPTDFHIFSDGFVYHQAVILRENDIFTHDNDIWVSCKDLITTSLEIMVSTVNYPTDDG